MQYTICCGKRDAKTALQLCRGLRGRLEARRSEQSFKHNSVIQEHAGLMQGNEAQEQTLLA